MQVGDAFVKFSAQVNTASFNRAKQEINNTARELKSKLRKETGDAKDAMELLGRAIGVNLPGSVRKFVASLPGVRPLLAGAFNASVVGAFGVAVAGAAFKLRDWYESMRAGDSDLAALDQRLGKVNLRLGEFGNATLRALRSGFQAEAARVLSEIKSLEDQIASDLQGTIFGSAGLANLRALHAEKGISLPLIGQITKSEMMPLKERYDDLVKSIGEVNEALSDNRGKELAEGLKRQKDAAKEAAESFKALAMTTFQLGEQQRILNDVLDRRRQLPNGFTLPLQFETEAPKIASQLRDIGAEGRKVWDSTRTSLERYNLELAHLRELLAANAIDTEVFTRATDSLKRELGLVADGTSKAGAVFNEVWPAIGSGLEQAIVNFRSWRDVAVGAIQDVARAILRHFVISRIMDFLGGLNIFGGGSGGGFNIPIGQNAIAASQTSLTPRAAGGPVFPGHAYMVGEHGREMFVPHTAGTIVANGAGGGIHLHQDNRGADFGTVTRIAAVMSDAKLRAFARQVRDNATRTP